MRVRWRPSSDPALLDPVRVQYGKDAKPTPLHDYATVGVRDNCLIITAYDESVGAVAADAVDQAH